MSALSPVPSDKRPFKGKGGAEWLAKVEREYRRVLEDMDRLSERSREGAGSPWYVYLHYRKETGQHFLRWRSFGSRHVHLRWDSMQGLLRRMTEAQRAWFEAVNDEIALLNAKEKAARASLHVASGLMSGAPAKACENTGE